MNHYGNVTNINGAEVEPVDIITFGSPCQDISVAGKRSGMKHEVLGDNETTRSGLFFEAIRIIKEMRESTNGEYPKYAVYENVPGAFSSNKGRDFHAVLEAFCSICDDTVSIPKPYGKGKRADRLDWNKSGEIVGDNYSVAWRTFDAQYWGVPQRRKRIYLVADFTGGSAGEILFESEGVSRDFTPSGSPWKGTAGDAEGSVAALQGSMIGREEKNGPQGSGVDEGLSFTLNTVDRHAVAYAMTTGGFTQVTEEKSPTLMSRDYKDPPLVSQPDYIVRRLTPTECARLQGFPDWWSTLAPYNPADAEFWEDVRKTHAEINGKTYKPVKDIKKWYDKLHTNSAEYKMWGNGIALPNAEFVLHGIAEQGAKTLGSLFDGSGGFPLAGMLNGIMPVWASEVEPYPIAVTKSRFKAEQDD